MYHPLSPQQEILCTNALQIVESNLHKSKMLEDQIDIPEVGNGKPYQEIKRPRNPITWEWEGCRQGLQDRLSGRPFDPMNLRNSSGDERDTLTWKGYKYGYEYCDGKTNPPPPLIDGSRMQSLD
jgi:hypothetical protein